MSRRNSIGDISYRFVMAGLAGFAVLILVAPVAVVLIVSFTDSRTLGFPPPGFSLRWYEQLFDPVASRQIHRAAFNSLEVAMWAAGAATVLGTCAAVGLSTMRSRTGRMLDASLMSPLVLPGLAYGLAALMFFSFLGLQPSLTLIIIGHGIMIVPFVLRTTGASLMQLDPSLAECSASLGAGRFYTFRRVTLPIILPGIAAGAFMAFMASIDNVPVSLFLSGPRSDMLPIRLWGMMESRLDVRVAAVSGVLIVAVLGLMLIMERVVGLTKRFQS